jgi:hypothetical protein
MRVRTSWRALGKKQPIHPVFSQPDPFIRDGPGAAGVNTLTVIPQRQIQWPEVGNLANSAEVESNDKEEIIRCSVEIS